VSATHAAIGDLTKAVVMKCSCTYVMVVKRFRMIEGMALTPGVDLADTTSN